MNKTLLSNNNHPNISLTCQKFQYGGGMERYLIDIVNGLSQANITPKIYSAKFDTALPEYDLINPVKINLSFVPKKWRTSFLSYFSNKYKETSEVSLTTSYTLSDVVICGGNHKGYLQASKKKPSISDRFKIMGEQKSLNQSKYVIAHSALMKKELVELYHIPENKIDVIYPPINTDKFTQINEEERVKLREKLGFKKDEVIYLFPSTGHTRKGFDILKKYFEKTQLLIRLVVAGTPVEENPKISSLGFCKNMPELYQAADFTIMASQYEPFGLVGLESILSGTPVIFSENMGCLEVLQHEFGYTFSRENMNTLDDAIQKSVKQASEHQHRILNPMDCIRYNPSLSHHIKAILEVIAK